MKVRMEFEKKVNKMCDLANRIEREDRNEGCSEGEGIGEERGLLQGKIEL